MMWTCVWTAAVQTLMVLVVGGLLIGGYIKWVDWCAERIDGAKASLIAAMSPAVIGLAVFIFIAAYKDCCK